MHYFILNVILCQHPHTLLSLYVVVGVVVVVFWGGGAIHRFALYRYCIIIKLCSSDHEILQCRPHYSARSIDLKKKKKKKEEKKEANLYTYADPFLTECIQCFRAQFPSLAVSCSCLAKCHRAESTTGFSVFTLFNESYRA